MKENFNKYSLLDRTRFLAQDIKYFLTDNEILDRLSYNISNNKHKFITGSVIASNLAFFGIAQANTTPTPEKIQQNVHKEIKDIAPEKISNNVDTLSKVLASSMEIKTEESEKVKDDSTLLVNQIANSTKENSKSISNQLFSAKQEDINNQILEQEAQRKAEEERKRKEAEEKKKAEQARLAALKSSSKSYNHSVNVENNILTLNGQKYRIIEVINNVEATAYDNGYQSTGKRPGDRGYAKTASGTTTHWGTAAIDRRYHNFGDLFYVVDDISILNNKPNGKLFVAEDTGGAIKGKARMDLWFDSYNEALKFGRRHITVYKLEKL